MTSTYRMAVIDAIQPLQRGGEYLFIIEHENACIFLRLQSRRRALAIEEYNIQTDDLSFELNFYPYRAALLRMDGGGYIRLPHDGDAALTEIPALETASDILDLDGEG